MKKLINTPEREVDEALAGMAAAHPDLIRVEEPNIIVRKDAPRPGKEGVISGGGSGHEPMHGGFVGLGMLDAACPGAVFTSPVPDQMLAATKAVNGGVGVLHIVKNYTGDIMNFEIAAELAGAAGIEVKSVVMADDVAVKDSLWTAGRRGVGGTVLAEKITGAGAEKGYDLTKLADLCRRVNAGGRSMGLALTSCTVPAAGKPTFVLGDDEIEMGIGIHGEPGRTRMKMKSADELTEMMARSIIEDGDYSRMVHEWDEKKGEWVDVTLVNKAFKDGDQVIAFVNGMGGTPLIELQIIYRKLHEVCEKKGLKIVRNLIGSYITSLEMQGCSITLVRADQEMIELWDAPVRTPGLCWGII